MNQASRKILARNLRALKEHDKRLWSDKELARRSTVSDRMIGRILASESSASVDILDKLAKPFKLTGWQLLVNVPDINEISSFSELFSNYTQANAEGKEHILTIAEREAVYSTASPGLKRATEDIEEIADRITGVIPNKKKAKKTN